MNSRYHLLRVGWVRHGQSVLAVGCQPQKSWRYAILELRPIDYRIPVMRGGKLPVLVEESKLASMELTLVDDPRVPDLHIGMEVMAEIRMTRDANNRRVFEVAGWTTLTIWRSAKSRGAAYKEFWRGVKPQVASALKGEK